MKRLRVFAVVVVSAVVALAAIFFAVNHFAPTPAETLGAAPAATPITHYGLEYGSLSDTLVSPDNVSIHVVVLKKTATAWWFHFQVHNNTINNVSFVNSSTSHYFVLVGRGTVNRPYTFDELALKLTAPTQENASAYPPLSPTVAAGNSLDGWLVADLTHFKYKPFQLMYVYGTFSSPACSNPRIQSTCHPSKGYDTLVWNL